MSLLYGHVEEAFYLRQIVRVSSTGLGPAQRELKQLTAAGLVIKDIQGRQTYYRANKNSPVFAEIKSIVTKTMGVRDVLYDSLKPLSNRVGAAFIYGSVAKGIEKPGSDLDLMVIGNITFGEVVACLQKAQETLLREINPTVYPVAEFQNTIAKGDYFLRNVLNETKIFIIGDDDNLRRMAGKRLGDETTDESGRN